MTPPLSLKGTTDRTTSNYSLSIDTSCLLILNLASNTASCSSFRPKRRLRYAPTKIIIHPILKRESNVSYFASPSPYASSKASALKLKQASAPYFPKILATPST